MFDLILSLLTDPGFAIGYFGAMAAHLDEVLGTL